MSIIAAAINIYNVGDNYAASVKSLLSDKLALNGSR